MTAMSGAVAILAALHKMKVVGIRAGTKEHRFTGVWVVVTNGRVFVRPWNDKPSGWYRAFRKVPYGVIQIGGRELAVRARRT